MFYWVLKAILGPLLRLLFRPWVEGMENIPATGPAILASNHLSFSDWFFLPLPLPRNVTFLAKSEYFTGRASRAWSAGVLQRRRQVPMDRSGGGRSERALAPACACSPPATCSGSTPRAPGRPTAGCTAARPASRGWRWRPGAGDPGAR